VSFSIIPPVRRPHPWRRRVLLALVLLLAAVPALVTGVGCGLSGPVYRGPQSDHFDGERFRNLRDVPHGGLGAFLRWQWTRKRGPWSDQPGPIGPKPPARVGRGALRVTFINHATTLVQQDGLNLLTDPIWSERCSPFSWIGPRRKRPPGIRFEDLPPIDLVVISHNHYDHLDLPTLRRLAETHRPRFFVGLGNRALLEKAGITRVTELDWWQSIPLGEARELIGVPAQHFSNRGLFDRDGTLWLGYLIRGPAGTTYFAGDTGGGPHFAEIRRRHGAPRLALLPIGAYRPEWFMSRVHVSPEEAVAAHETLGAATSVGIHFGTFSLADDGQDEPARAVQTALRGRPPDRRPRFLVLAPGQGHDVE
jgi:L-ascorbate metabolism protein UlaG (beta-lactamase superfamily)